jgi:hypothetical protein
MPYSLAPNSTLVTPKASPDIQMTDTKFQSLIYTATALDASFKLITPVIDCRNLWAWVLHIKNTGETNAIYSVYVVGLLSATEATPTLSFTGYVSLGSATDYYTPPGANAIAAGASAFLYSRLTPHPPFIAFMANSTVGTNCECQFIGSYLHG